MSIIADFVKILELKRYSKLTIVSYKSHLYLTQRVFKNKPFKEITDKELFNFIYHLVEHKHISASYQRQIVGSLQLFYQVMYNRNIPFEYLQVKQREHKLPVVLSKSEVMDIINNTNNLKHKAILSLIYSAGLRIGELLALKKSDIDSERMVIHIKGTKGKKDRYTILSPKVLVLLREYYSVYKPKSFLFEGQKGGKYTAESAGQFFRKIVNKTKIDKHPTLYTLRHSFATHLVEDGIGITHIQKLLGHKNIQATLIYTHISNEALGNIKSPFDT